MLAVRERERGGEVQGLRSSTICRYDNLCGAYWHINYSSDFGQNLPSPVTQSRVVLSAEVVRITSCV